MDISFKCDNCGQDIVIDQAGAGQVVECRKCRASVMVPVGSGTTSPLPLLSRVPTVTSRVVVERIQGLPLEVTFGKEALPVVVRDFDMSIGNMVWFLVKLAVAAIPAVIILGVFAAAVAGVVAVVRGIGLWSLK